MGSVVHYGFHTLQSLQLSYGSLEIMSIQFGNIVWDSVACRYLPTCYGLLSEPLVTTTTHKTVTGGDKMSMPWRVYK